MFKSSNVGNLDRVIRIVSGALLIALPFVYPSGIWASPFVQWGVPIVGAILVLTALVRFCPLYRLIGANTCKVG